MLTAAAHCHRRRAAAITIAVAFCLLLLDQIPTVARRVLSPLHLIPNLSFHSLTSPKSAVSTAEPIPISLFFDASLASEEETQFQISLDKLFVSSETDVSLDDANLRTRILRGSNIVLSKCARDSQVVQADFVKSSVKTEDCPGDEFSEFTLVGRSNVGKSSLLNSIVRRKKLALTSKKPGKTQCINHFQVNDSWFLVDLPGYSSLAFPE